MNRRKLQYLEGVMSLDRELVVSGVKKVRSKNAGIELEIGTSERALDDDLPDTLNTEIKRVVQIFESNCALARTAPDHRSPPR